MIKPYNPARDRNCKSYMSKAETQARLRQVDHDHEQSAGALREEVERTRAELQEALARESERSKHDEPVDSRAESRAGVETSLKHGSRALLVMWQTSSKLFQNVS